jgi:hypothetical protein
VVHGSEVTLLIIWCLTFFVTAQHKRIFFANPDVVGSPRHVATNFRRGVHHATRQNSRSTRRERRDKQPNFNVTFII